MPYILRLAINLETTQRTRAALKATQEDMLGFRHSITPPDEHIAACIPR